MSVPPIAPVEPALAELRLAVGLEVAVRPVALEDVDDRAARVASDSRALAAEMNVEVVGRRVVLAGTGRAAAHQRADRGSNPGELYWRSS